MKCDECILSLIKDMSKIAVAFMSLTVAPPGTSSKECPIDPYPISGGTIRVVLAPTQSPRSPSSPVIL
jgi:hypothetical protein